MKLYIKEKVFSWGDKLTVKDEHGYDNMSWKAKYLPGVKNCISMI